jgi:DNA-binding transcriptional MerR regulator
VTVQLLIGEVAKLLGVTTKTLRYYEEIGLLGEPLRTESGYRLYQAQDLLQLYRIKQMQELGLSLERIRTLLQEPDRAQRTLGSPEAILRTLEAEITAQITELEARREHIRALLAQAPADNLAQHQEMPPTLKLLQEQLGQQLEFDTASAPLTENLFAQLDVFLWSHAEYRKQQQELIEHIAANPEAGIQMAGVVARVTALAEAPAAPGEVEALAEEIVRLRRQNPILAKMLSFSEWWEESEADVLGQILAGVTATELSPAQRRLFQLAAQRLAQVQNEESL